MTQFIKGEALVLDAGVLPAKGADGEIRYSSADNTLRKWDDALNDWVLIGGGAGGGFIDWNSAAGQGPLRDEEFGNPIFLFETIETTVKLTAAIKVPDGYQPGTQIFMFLSAYTSEIAGSDTISMNVNLVRKNTDAIDSTVNSGSFGGAMAHSAPANKLIEVSFDVTNASGQINGVPVGAGDLLTMTLHWGGGSGVGTMKVLASSTQVKF